MKDSTSRQQNAYKGCCLCEELPCWFRSQLLCLVGLSKEKDEAGFHTYRRPEGKSGGHGVGWSEIPVYTFKVWQCLTHIGGLAQNTKAACSVILMQKHVLDERIHFNKKEIKTTWSWQVPDGWKEVPVSIADLGGTEVGFLCDTFGFGKVQGNSFRLNLPLPGPC